MEVTFDNTDGMRPHTVHFHAVQKTVGRRRRPDDDGNHRRARRETHVHDPGERAGHPSLPLPLPDPRHIDMGMYGIFRVDPKGYEPADKEYFMTLKEWDSRLNRQMAGEGRQLRRSQPQP